MQEPILQNDPQILSTSRLQFHQEIFLKVYIYLLSNVSLPLSDVPGFHSQTFYILLLAFLLSISPGYGGSSEASPWIWRVFRSFSLDMEDLQKPLPGYGRPLTGYGGSSEASLTCPGSYKVVVSHFPSTILINQCENRKNIQRVARIPKRQRKFPASSFHKKHDKFLKAFFYLLSLGWKSKNNSGAGLSSFFYSYGLEEPRARGRPFL
jgi:hypothetical protein